MSVTFNSNMIIPAPFATISRETLAREDGALIGHTYAITLKGKLSAWQGSPNSTGAFWTASGYPADESVIQANLDARLGAILRKQGALRALFATDGASLEIQSADASAPMKCNPRVKGVSFTEGPWVETCEYQVTLEADSIIGVGDATEPNGLVTKVNEEWNMEVLDEKQGTFRLTHSLSATGKRVYDVTGTLLNGKQAWQNAQDYVLNQNVNNGGFGLGLDVSRMQNTAVLGPFATSLQAFNYIRNNSINETSGVFSVTETWVCYDPQGQPPALNDYTVTLRYSEQDNKTSVNIEGTVTGFEVRDTNTHTLVSTRWTNGLAKWANDVFPNLFTIAQTAAGITLNPFGLSNSIAMNAVAGTVNYHWEYDNRPIPITAGAISEHVTVNDTHAGDVFASIPVLGRAIGPVLQSIGTITEKKRTIQIEVQMPPTTMTFSASEPNTFAIVAALKPSGFAVFLQSDEESWNPNSGRYNRTTTFVWE